MRAYRGVGILFLGVTAAMNRPAWGLVPQEGTQPGTLTVPFKTPANCAGCHQFSAAHSPNRSWAGSMMANATRDPLLWAALAIAEQDVPEVGDMCLRCHSPVGWLGGRVTVGEPPPTQGEKLTSDDFEGVTCHFCHRMTTGSNGKVIRQNAQFFIANDDVRRGAYQYNSSRFEPPHGWVQSSLFTSSDLCGQCHNVTNPIVPMRNTNGTVIAGGFPIERTYAEWKASAFSGPNGQTCQDCHMPSSRNVRGCTMTEAPLHDSLRRHEFAGGNAFIPLVLQGEYPNLRRGDSFQATRDAALKMLGQNSATLSIVQTSALLPNRTVKFQVRVTNWTGHKLPTGYPEGRRMWLHVTAKLGSAPQPVFESGKARSIY